MTIEEARSNVGRQFKALAFIGAPFAWDVIRAVDDDGWIEGDHLIAPCADCRLKGEQPDQLKKYQYGRHNSN